MQVLDLQQADYDDAYSNGTTTTNGTVDAAFKKVPRSSTGFHIWRIEHMNVVALGRNQYGTFYDNDSYVILAASSPGQTASVDSVMREIRGGALEYHIHFWLGSSTTPDKSGVAAYKTVELDGYLGGTATQHREMQGNESCRFRSYFKNGFRILKGHQDINGDSLMSSCTKLYKVKGKRNPVVIEQEAVSWKHFNSGDVFLLLTPTIIFVWVGRAANSIEKLHATKTAVQLKTESNLASLVFVDDGYEQSLQNEHKTQFQKYLPLNQRHVLPSDPTDDETVEKQFRSSIKLYKCSDNSGKYRVTEVKSGPLLQSDLDSDDVFILDHGAFGIWVWVGKRANDKERTEAMRNARGFVKKKKYVNETNVTRVIEGAEPREFKILFVAWKQRESSKAKLGSNGSKGQKLAITKFDAALMHERPSLAAETQLLDDGTGTSRIWRIRKNDAVEITKEKFGNFYSGDCYLVWYSYQSQGQRHILYSWFGLHASEDEMSNTFLKRNEIENELGGQAIKVRVVQGREPAQLLQIFKGKLVIFRGKGIEQDESGRNKTPSNYLLHVQGSATYNSKATQVITKATSLNSNYCFVLRKSKKYFVWSGINSTGDHREMAKHFTGKDFELVLEGKEPQEFWDLLGGKAEYSTAKMTIEENDLKCPRLFHCPNTLNYFKAEEVFNFTQSDLTPEDVMLLDAFSTVFIWIGKLSTTFNRKSSLDMALEYLRNDPAGRDVNIPIVEIRQGNEPPNFMGFFPNWSASWWSEHVPFEELRCQLEGVKIEKRPEVLNGNHIESDFDKYEKYPVKMLKESSDKLPNKVDPLQKELYLTHDDFVFLFKMKYEEFKSLPRWKQQELKKKVGLF